MENQTIIDSGNPRSLDISSSSHDPQTGGVSDQASGTDDPGKTLSCEIGCSGTVVWPLPPRIRRGTQREG